MVFRHGIEVTDWRKSVRHVALDLQDCLSTYCLGDLRLRRFPNLKTLTITKSKGHTSRNCPRCHGVIVPDMVTYWKEVFETNDISKIPRFVLLSKAAMDRKALEEKVTDSRSSSMDGC